MIELLSNLARLPVAVFISGCEVLVRVMREVQTSLDRGTRAMAGSVEKAVGETLQALGAATGAAGADTAGEEKETSTMVDQDLSGDYLKLVRYRIIYTKRDHEELLANEDALVNYSTTVADYGGRITCKWIESHEAEVKAKHMESKYFQTFVEVLARYPKQEKEYDKEQVKVLEEQVTVLREIRDKIKI